tara:strand:- start:220 stop:975 length:756 start_codon:yes stop_codon:yes gene_type:complete
MASVGVVGDYNPFNNDFDCAICYEYCFGNKQDCRVCVSAICNSCYEHLNQVRRLRNKCPSCRSEYIPEEPAHEPEPEPEPEPPRWVTLSDVAIDYDFDRYDAGRNRFYTDRRWSITYIRRIINHRHRYTINHPNHRIRRIGTIFNDDTYGALDEFDLGQYRVFRMVKNSRGYISMVSECLCEITKVNEKSVRIENTSNPLIQSKTYKILTDRSCDEVYNLLGGTGGQVIKIPNQNLYLVSAYSNMCHWNGE